MKVLNLVLIFAIMAAVKGDHEKWKAFKTECIESSGVDVEVIAKWKKGESSDDPKLKEFVFCMGKKSGGINEAGEIQLDFIKSKFNDHLGAEKTATIFTECVPDPEAEIGAGAEATFKVSKCFFEKAYQHFKAKE